MYLCIVKRFVMRILVVATLLCGFLGSRMGVRAEGFVGNEQKNEEQIKQFDGWLRQIAEEPQSPVEAALRTAPSSTRLASSRPTRLLPTHSGRTNHHGRWVADRCGFLQTLPREGITKSLHASGRAFSSPRLYYVIALRRLLC